MSANWHSLLFIKIMLKYKILKNIKFSKFLKFYFGINSNNINDFYANLYEYFDDYYPDYIDNKFKNFCDFFEFIKENFDNNCEIKITNIGNCYDNQIKLNDAKIFFDSINEFK